MSLVWCSLLEPATQHDVRALGVHECAGSAILKTGYRCTVAQEGQCATACVHARCRMCGGCVADDVGSHVERFIVQRCGSQNVAVPLTLYILLCQDGGEYSNVHSPGK